MKLSETLMGKFRIVAFLEGCSYLLLGLTMILKYKYMMREPNYVVGMIHGFLFILYVVMLLRIWQKYKWSFGKATLAFIASLVPFGTFVADKKLFRHY
jgi:integral membrane protein